MAVHQKVFIAGSQGMVGKALCQKLRERGCRHLLTPSRQELDLTQQKQVRDYMHTYRPDVVIIAAAKVGGIYANMTFPADFFYENLMIQSHLIHEAHCAGVQRLLSLGTSCIYPKNASQPITEEALLTGTLESTNEGYALAKISAVKMCSFYAQQYKRCYIAAMPTNLYGPGDRYHDTYSHVIPALMKRFHEAKRQKAAEVVVWGSGKPKREFLHVEDLARGCLVLLDDYYGISPVNIGSPEEITIADLAKKIAKVVGFCGAIAFDTSKPDGVLRKKTSIERITRLGWHPQISLEEGLSSTYQDFLSRY